MFVIQAAKIPVGIDNRYPLVEEQCAGYYTDQAPAFTVRCSEEEIEKELSACSLPEGIAPERVRGYAESVCLYRKLCLKMPEYDGFLFHSAALEYAGRAYLFTAPPGTGKSTHLRLWMRNFGKDLKILNGDKPLLRKEEGKFIVYGTPWKGKEGWGENRFAPLGGVCILRRGQSNRIEKLTPFEASSDLFSAVLFPHEPVTLQKMLALADNLLQSVPFYRLYCTISNEAAQLSFHTLTGD